MHSLRPVLASWLGLFACGPSSSTDAPVPFAELCGEAEALHLVPLADDELVLPGRAVQRHGDRWLVTVREYDAPVTDVHTARVRESDHDATGQIGARIVSVDACGGDEHIVARGIDLILAPPDDDGTWLGCSNANALASTLWWFDPTGSRPARELFETQNCNYIEHGDAIVARRGAYDEPGDLVRVIPDTGELAVLEPDLAAWEPVTNAAYEPTGEVLGLSTIGDLISVELSTGVRTVLLGGVQEFHVLANGRFIAWVPGSPAAPPASFVRWRLYDRDTGDERLLGRESWERVSMLAWPAMLRVSDESNPRDPSEETQFVWLPGGEESWLEGGWTQIAFDNADEHLVRRIGDDEEAGLYVIDSPAAPPRFLYKSATRPIVRDDVVVVDHDDAYPSTSSGEPETSDPLHWIIEVPLDGSEARVVARDVYFPAWISDRRFATVGGFAPDGIGELRLVDDSGTTLNVLDADVYSWFAGLWPWRPGDPWRPIEPRDAILYTVHDPSPERMGLWLARLAPR